MTSDLTAEINSRKIELKRRDGREISCIGIESISELSGTTGRCAVEKKSLEAGIVPFRYARNMDTISSENQIRLLESTAAVVGLGGLGGYVTEILARTGVGNLILIDGDVFDETNLNRQLFCTEGAIGKSKVESAAERVYSINASVNVKTYHEWLSAGNAVDLLAGGQVVIDCLDSVEARFVVSNAAEKLGIPMITAAVAGTAGQAATIYPGDGGLERIYGNQHEHSGGAEDALGCLPYTVMLIAALECTEAVKIISGEKPGLKDRLFIMDLADYTFETMQLISP